MAWQNVNPGGTRYPDIRLRWAPTSQPTDASQTYVDITDRLRSWSWSYGRNDELGTFEAGSGSVLLDNSDRAFDPSYNAGPWFGNIKPRKVFEMVARWNAVEYPVFIGYARGFPQEYLAYGVDQVVKVDVVDAFAVLQNIDLTVGFSAPEQMAAERLTDILDDLVGYPASFKGIDGDGIFGTFANTPTPVVGALEEVTTAGTSALDHAKTVAESAGGQLFVAPNGLLKFHCYERRLNAANLYTFSDAVGAPLRYQDVAPAFDETYMWNFARVTGAGGDETAATAESASVADDFNISKTISTLLVNGSDIQQVADRTILHYPAAELRAPSLTTQGAANPAAMWPVLLDLDVSDRITVTRFAGSADPMVLVQNVEGISHQCQPGGPWNTTLSTSPADTRTYLVANDATFGITDTTNVAA